MGKSKLVERYLMDEYNPRQLSTFALTLFRKNAQIDGAEVKVGGTLYIVRFESNGTAPRQDVGACSTSSRQVYS